MPTELTHEQATELFAHAQRIGNIILSFYSTEYSDTEPWTEDRRKDGPNPFYSQTETGLFIEFYYGAPSYLWTPWGKWSMLGSSEGVSNQYAVAMLASLTVEVDTPLVTNHMGEFGPVYAVLAVEGVQLPRPRKADHQHYLAYEICKEAWARLDAEYSAAAATR